MTGSGGRFTCPSDSVLNCAAAITLTSGHVTTFSPEEWSPTDGKYCNASGLRGSVFSYSGPDAVDGGNLSSNSHGVDARGGQLPPDVDGRHPAATRAAASRSTAA